MGTIFNIVLKNKLLDFFLKLSGCEVESCRSDESESETVSVSIYLVTKLKKLGQLF